MQNSYRGKILHQILDKKKLKKAVFSIMKKNQNF